MTVTDRKLEGFAKAQRTNREVIHEVAQSVRPGDTEVEVARRIEVALERAGAKRWLHTPYVWWGERARFAPFKSWEADALPTHRRLLAGESFILDAAPLIDGAPADYAFSGIADAAWASKQVAGDHAMLLQVLSDIKAELPQLAADATDGGSLYQSVNERCQQLGGEVVHSLYPASVLGHVFTDLPTTFLNSRRVGEGFQWPLVGTYAICLAKHRIFGAPYPFINGEHRGRPHGLYAVEPHVARGQIGAKFESLLWIDGAESRWLDPELFGAPS